MESSRHFWVLAHQMVRDWTEAFPPVFFRFNEQHRDSDSHVIFYRRAKGKSQRMASPLWSLSLSSSRERYCSRVAYLSWKAQTTPPTMMKDPPYTSGALPGRAAVPLPEPRLMLELLPLSPPCSCCWVRPIRRRDATRSSRRPPSWWGAALTLTTLPSSAVSIRLQLLLKVLLVPTVVMQMLLKILVTNIVVQLIPPPISNYFKPRPDWFANTQVKWPSRVGGWLNECLFGQIWWQGRPASFPVTRDSARILPCRR